MLVVCEDESTALSMGAPSLAQTRYWITGLQLARLGQEPAGNQSEHEVVRTHMLEQLKYLLADSSGSQA